MSSCILFHGPGARSAALSEASKIGVLIAPPFGDDGLKTGTAREIVLLMQDTPVGSSVGTLVIGPMDADRANPKACDVLLKCLEEFDDALVQPILWASDLGSVIPTIRSRCLARWVRDIPVVDEELEDIVAELVEAVLSDRLAKVSALVRNVDSKKLPDLIGMIADHLVGDPAGVALWERVRKVAIWKNPTVVELVGALVGGA